MERILKKLSVIIPVYNAEKTLKKCIESVLKQKDEDLEIVLINDGSTDKSLSVLQKIAEQHDNMQIIDKENGGVSSARNIGLQVAKGEYIYFFDGDDFFMGVVVLLFTFILPAANSVLVFYRIIAGKKLNLFLDLDKWNMLDVFVVALLLLNFKLQSNIMVMELKIGTTFIALSVVFRIITTILIDYGKPSLLKC